MPRVVCLAASNEITDSSSLKQQLTKRVSSTFSSHGTQVASAEVDHCEQLSPNRDLHILLVEISVCFANKQRSTTPRPIGTLERTLQQALRPVSDDCRHWSCAHSLANVDIVLVDDTAFDAGQEKAKESWLQLQRAVVRAAVQAFAHSLRSLSMLVSAEVISDVLSFPYVFALQYTKEIASSAGARNSTQRGVNLGVLVRMCLLLLSNPAKDSNSSNTLSPPMLQPPLQLFRTLLASSPTTVGLAVALNLSPQPPPSDGFFFSSALSPSPHTFLHQNSTSSTSSCETWNQNSDDEPMPNSRPTSTHSAPDIRKRVGSDAIQSRRPKLLSNERINIDTARQLVIRVTNLHRLQSYDLKIVDAEGSHVACSGNIQPEPNTTNAAFPPLDVSHLADGCLQIFALLRSARTPRPKPHHNTTLSTTVNKHTFPPELGLVSISSPEKQKNVAHNTLHVHVQARFASGSSAGESCKLRAFDNSGRSFTATALRGPVRADCVRFVGKLMVPAVCSIVNVAVEVKDSFGNSSSSQPVVVNFL